MWCLNELFLSINVISALHGGCVSSSWPTHIHAWITQSRSGTSWKALKLRFSFSFWLSHLPPKFPQLKRKCARLKPAVMARSRWLTERAFVDEPKIETSLVPGWLKKQAQPTLSGLGRSGDLMRSTIMICCELLSCLSKQVLFSLSIPFYLQL